MENWFTKMCEIGEKIKNSCYEGSSLSKNDKLK